MKKLLGLVLGLGLVLSSTSTLASQTDVGLCMVKHSGENHYLADFVKDLSQMAIEKKSQNEMSQYGATHGKKMADACIKNKDKDACDFLKLLLECTKLQ